MTWSWNLRTTFYSLWGHGKLLNLSVLQFLHLIIRNNKCLTQWFIVRIKRCNACELRTVPVTLRLYLVNIMKLPCEWSSLKTSYCLLALLRPPTNGAPVHQRNIFINLFSLSATCFLFIFYLFIFLYFCFLGPHPRHMEVLRLGAELEL